MAARAVDLAPDDPSTHLTLGLVCMSRARWHREARRALRRALALDPESSAARVNLASLDLPWRPVAAARGLGASLALDPRSAVARQNMVLVLVRLLWLSFVLLWVGSRLALSGGRPALAAAGVCVLAVGALLGSAVVRLPTGTRALARGLPRQRPLVALAGTALLVSGVLLAGHVALRLAAGADGATPPGDEGRLLLAGPPLLLAGLLLLVDSVRTRGQRHTRYEGG